MSYAKGTQVSAERSREEIDRLLARYGACLLYTSPSPRDS